MADVRKLRDDMAGLMPHAPLVHACTVVVGVVEVEEVVGDGHEQHEVEGGEGVVDDRLPEDMTYPAVGAGEEVQMRMDQEVRLDVGWKGIDRRRVGYGVAGWVVLENPVAVEEEVGEEIVGRLAGSSGQVQAGGVLFGAIRGDDGLLTVVDEVEGDMAAGVAPEVQREGCEMVPIAGLVREAHTWAVVLAADQCRPWRHQQEHSAQ